MKKIILLSLLTITPFMATAAVVQNPLCRVAQIEYDARWSEVRAAIATGNQALLTEALRAWRAAEFQVRLFCGDAP